MGYRYKYFDLNCAYCMDKAKIGCSISLCPHIMDNLPDLIADKTFRKAVYKAESCESLHRNTLCELKRRSGERGYNFSVKVRNRGYLCNFKPDCKGCTYAANGFMCHNPQDRSCLKDWLKEISNAGR